MALFINILRQKKGVTTDSREQALALSFSSNGADQLPEMISSIYSAKPNVAAH